MARSKFYGFAEGGQYEDRSVFDRHINDNAAIQLHKLDRGFALIQYDGSVSFINNQPMNGYTLLDLGFPTNEDCPARWKEVVSWNAMNISPEFPNGIFSNLGETAIAGTMITEHDVSTNFNYYKWTSSEVIWQHYGIVVNYWFPEVSMDWKVIWDSFSFVVKIVGDAQCRLQIYDFADDIVFETTITNTSSTWETQELSPTALGILNNGDPTPPQWAGRKLRLVFRLSSQNDGQVLLSDVNSSFHYGLVTPTAIYPDPSFSIYNRGIYNGSSYTSWADAGGSGCLVGGYYGSLIGCPKHIRTFVPGSATTVDGIEINDPADLTWDGNYELRLIKTNFSGSLVLQELWAGQIAISSGVGSVTGLGIPVSLNPDEKIHFLLVIP